MAEYNEILVGRFNRSLQKLLGMKGGPPAAQLSGEIMPVLPFTLGVENRYLEGFTMYGAAPGPTGGVGQTAGIRLRNPINSNVLVIVQLLILFGANGHFIRSQIAIFNPHLTTFLTAFPLHPRRTLPSSP